MLALWMKHGLDDRLELTEHRPLPKEERDGKMEEGRSGIIEH